MGRGIGAQIGLARRVSPNKAARLLGLAHAVAEMPHTRAVWEAGEITEWRASLLARETGCLSREDRTAVDAELAALPGGLPALGDQACEREARRVAYRLDPYAVTRRAAKAVTERTVSVRPAPDTMTYVTGPLPVREGVGVYAALSTHADTLRTHGDERTRGQIMADTLVERITGQATANAVPTEVQVIINDDALFGGGDSPAHVPGYGPVPAPVVRAWLREDTEEAATAGSNTEPAGSAEPHTSQPQAAAPEKRQAPEAEEPQTTGAEEAAAKVWIRRLFTGPTASGSTQLVGMDSRRRLFPAGLRRFVIARDQVCRTPWCDAPIREVDHPQRWADGGNTTQLNSQGLCTACNQTKQAPGWNATPTTSRTGHQVDTTTPTGHTYRSLAPPPPGTKPPPWSVLEIKLHELLLAA